METLSHPYTDEYYYTLSPQPYGPYDLNYQNELYYYNNFYQDYRAMEMNSPYHVNSYLYNYANPYTGGSEYGIPSSVPSSLPRTALTYYSNHELAAPIDSAQCHYRTSGSGGQFNYEKTMALQNRKRKAYSKIDNMNARKRRKKDSKINPKLKVLIQALRESVRLDYFKVLKEVNMLDTNIPVEFSILSRKGFMDVYCKYCEGFKKPKNWENMYRNVSKQGYAKSNGKKFILDKSVYSVVAMLYKEFSKSEGSQLYKDFVKSESGPLPYKDIVKTEGGAPTLPYKDFVKTEGGQPVYKEFVKNEGGQ